MNLISKLLFLAIIFAPVYLQAQDPESVLTEGKVWQRHDFSPNRPDKTTTVKIDGDTVVNERVCKKVGLYENGERVSVKVFHEDNGIIDFWSSTRDGWKFKPVINFNVNEGDSIVAWNEFLPDTFMGVPLNYRNVVRVFTIDLFGHTRKCVAVGWYRDNGTLYTCGYWIEGVGATSDDCLLRIEDCKYPDQYFPYLESCYDGDELIYTKMEFENALKLAGISDITPDSPSASDDDGPIYNLQGQPVAHPRSGEIYIRSGRKFLCP